MELIATKGKEVCISFWTNDQGLLFALRKLLMINAIRFEWVEHEKKGFIYRSRRGRR